MPKCVKCNYELVLLSNRPKYKCAVCSRLYPKKEIEAKEFRTWNKWQRKLDTEKIDEEKKKKLVELREVRKDVKLLFNPKQDTKECQSKLKQKRKEYYERNKEILTQKTKAWRLKHRESELERYKRYYGENKKTIQLKAKERRKKNKDVESERQKRWRKNNLEMVRIYGMIHHYRQKQKELAVSRFENGQYKSPNNEIEASLSTSGLSYLLWE